MTTILGTAAAAEFFLALTMAPTPTVSHIPPVLEAKQARPIQKNTSRLSLEVASTRLSTIVANENNYEEASRPTTAHENIVGEIRRWSLLDADWDGEGAAAPKVQSIKEVVSFVRLLNDNIALPEPMLLASGHAALYWNEGSLYADIEFLGDGHIAYFIKSNGDKHKGVLSFDLQKIPDVFQALIWA